MIITLLARLPQDAASAVAFCMSRASSACLAAALRSSFSLACGHHRRRETTRALVRSSSVAGLANATRPPKDPKDTVLVSFSSIFFSSVPLALLDVLLSVAECVHQLFYGASPSPSSAAFDGLDIWDLAFARTSHIFIPHYALL